MSGLPTGGHYRPPEVQSAGPGRGSKKPGRVRDGNREEERRFAEGPFWDNRREALGNGSISRKERENFLWARREERGRESSRLLFCSHRRHDFPAVVRL